MSVQVDALGLVIAVLMLLIVAFLVPLLIQARNTAQRIDEFLHEAQRDLLPMLKEMREASEHLNKASAGAGSLADVVGEAGETLRRVNDFLQNDVGRCVGDVTGLWLGIRAASKVFLRQMKQQQEGE